jgi:hypothetical protein
MGNIKVTQGRERPLNYIKDVTINTVTNRTVEQFII